ncbi:Peptidase S1 domain-containing protein [Aphelenchoides besseyi]|nr:Peptidase S1 domain-containing protein [Aphelenchoides besseyi]
MRKMIVRFLTLNLLVLVLGFVVVSTSHLRTGRKARALYSNFSHVHEAGRVVRIESYYHETADFCTGVLLSETVVLTAAHCIYRSDAHGPPTKILVNGNGHVSTVSGSSGKAIKHAKYTYNPSSSTINANVMCYDVALIFLKKRIPIPSNLPKMVVDCGTIYTERSCSGHGAGLTERNDLSRSIRRVPLPSLKSPTHPFNAPGCLETRYVGNERLCQGDSGGPVFCKRRSSKVYSLVGISVQVIGEKEEEGNFTIADSCKYSVGAIVSNTVAIAELVSQLPHLLQKGVLASVPFINCSI